MAFIETPTFPSDISFGSAGGPQFKTTVVRTWSGAEQRNQAWEYPLHRYNIKYGLKDDTDVHTVLQWFHATLGRLNGFRFRDRFDYWSGVVAADGSATPAWNDQNLGTMATGVTTYQLIKTYTIGAQTYSRQILKPEMGTVKVGWSGAEKTETVDWTIDTTTGIITVPTPVNGADIFAGYEFDVPVRFASDLFQASWEDAGIQSTDIILQEILL